tara:strand:+ start:1017 stop:1547 length:531 start_codon:yes stop_codon:yes gene_type:complete
MAEETNIKTYIIPLRKEYRKVANYRRAGRAVKFIKQYIARHMKVPDRDTSKVKLDMHFNNAVWFRGKKKPPAKIKVMATKDGDLIKVTFAETPQTVKFNKIKLEKRHKAPEKKAAPAAPVEEKKEQSEEDKKEEKEKAQSSTEAKQAQAKTQAKAQKHTGKVSKQPKHEQRKALKK